MIYKLGFLLLLTVTLASGRPTERVAEQDDEEFLFPPKLEELMRNFTSKIEDWNITLPKLPELGDVLEKVKEHFKNLTKGHFDKREALELPNWNLTLGKLEDVIRNITGEIKQELNITLPKLPKLEDFVGDVNDVLERIREEFNVSLPDLPLLKKRDAPKEEEDDEDEVLQLIHEYIEAHVDPKLLEHIQDVVEQIADNHRAIFAQIQRLRTEDFDPEEALQFLHELIADNFGPEAVQLIHEHLLQIVQHVKLFLEPIREIHPDQLTIENILDLGYAHWRAHFASEEPSKEIQEIHRQHILLIRNIAKAVSDIKADEVNVKQLLTLVRDFAREHLDAETREKICDALKAVKSRAAAVLEELNQQQSVDLPKALALFRAFVLSHTPPQVIARANEWLQAASGDIRQVIRAIVSIDLTQLDARAGAEQLQEFLQQNIPEDVKNVFKKIVDVLKALRDAKSQDVTLPNLLEQLHTLLAPHLQQFKECIRQRLLALRSWVGQLAQLDLKDLKAKDILLHLHEWVGEQVGELIIAHLTEVREVLKSLNDTDWENVDFDAVSQRLEEQFNATFDAEEREFICQHVQQLRELVEAVHGVDLSEVTLPSILKHLHELMLEQISPAEIREFVAQALEKLNQIDLTNPESLHEWILSHVDPECLQNLNDAIQQAVTYFEQNVDLLQGFLNQVDLDKFDLDQFASQLRQEFIKQIDPDHLECIRKELVAILDHIQPHLQRLGNFTLASFADHLHQQLLEHIDADSLAILQEVHQNIQKHIAAAQAVLKPLVEAGKEENLDLATAWRLGHEFRLKLLTEEQLQGANKIIAQAVDQLKQHLETITSLDCDIDKISDFLEKAIAAHFEAEQLLELRASLGQAVDVAQHIFSTLNAQDWNGPICDAVHNLTKTLILQHANPDLLKGIETAVRGWVQHLQELQQILDTIDLNNFNGTAAAELAHQIASRELDADDLEALQEAFENGLEELQETLKELDTETIEEFLEKHIDPELKEDIEEFVKESEEKWKWFVSQAQSIDWDAEDLLEHIVAHFEPLLEELENCPLEKLLEKLQEHVKSQ